MTTRRLPTWCVACVIAVAVCAITRTARAQSTDLRNGELWGQAAPPTTAGWRQLAASGPFVFRAGLEVIGQYAFRLTNDVDASRVLQATTSNRFDLPRAHLAVTGDLGPARARVVVEAVRSASEGALIGVAGDSWVVRLREAYASVRARDWLEVQLGVVPTLTVPSIEGTWRLRMSGPVPVEEARLLAPADLGVAARVRLPRGYGTVSVGVFNGDGYNQREFNRGKNLEVAAEIHPFPLGRGRPFALLASLVVGTSGVTDAIAHRLTVGVLYQGMIVRAGTVFTYAWGVEDRPDRQAYVLEAFANLAPVERMILAVRGSYTVRNTVVDDDHVWSLLVAGGVRVVESVEALAVVRRSIPGIATRSAVPGSDFWELSAVARAAF